MNITTSQSEWVIQPLKSISGHFYLTGDYELAVCALALGGLGSNPLEISGVPRHPSLEHWANHLEACGWKIERNDCWTIFPLEKMPRELPSFTPADNLQACIWAGIACCLEINTAKLVLPKLPDFLGFLWEKVPGNKNSTHSAIESASNTESVALDGATNQTYQIKAMNWSNHHELKTKHEPWEKLAYFFAFAQYKGEVCLESALFSNPTIEALLPMLGQKLEWDRKLQEPKNELERRLARLKKNQPKEKEKLKWSPPFTWNPSKLSLPGDITKANAYALASTLLKKSDVSLDNIYLHPQNLAFFSALRKMGADIEISGKREEGGIPKGEVRIRPSDLLGKRFGWENLNPLLKDISLLILAASFGHGETIFRDIEFLRQYPQDILKRFTETLKRGGVEIGEVEDGLVIRGRRELELSEVDAHKSFELAWAYSVLGICHHRPLTIQNVPDGFQDMFKDWYILLNPPKD